jgi:hypothetical protein
MSVDFLSIFAFIGLFLTMTAVYAVVRFIIMNFVDLAQERKDADRFDYNVGQHKRYAEGRGFPKPKTK